MRKLLILLLLSCSISSQANWFTDLIGVSENPIAEGRKQALGLTLEAKVKKFKFSMKGKLVTVEMKGAYKLFRSSWTGLCGIKGSRKIIGDSNLAEELNESVNSPIEESFCYLLDLSISIKQNFGACTSKSYLESEKGVEKTFIELNRNCQCTRKYVLKSSVPFQNPNGRVLVYTTSFQTYEQTSRNFVDF
ncbi:hypothetical protein [Halobacteriovorax sp. HLS]|uniref:hypothetical protein n=1 Tax=Halobacteriovorax sp. HLS TaxID=2234000 RepID=UPI000FDA301E|nr:hypothetical protein [Halobacteriovorax sp. HLS]